MVYDDEGFPWLIKHSTHEAKRIDTERLSSYFKYDSEEEYLKKLRVTPQLAAWRMAVFFMLESMGYSIPYSHYKKKLSIFKRLKRQNKRHLTK